MAQTDSSATRTPRLFIALAVLLCVLRLGFAASASPPVQSQSIVWKTASAADKESLPGAGDPKEPEVVANEPITSPKPDQLATQELFLSTPLSDEDRKSIQDGKPVLYEFVSNWSDPCKAMDKNALSNTTISKVIAENFVAVRITDVSREEKKNPQWITNLHKRYHVFALPALLVTDKSGTPKATLIGNCSSLTVQRFLARSLH